MVRVEGATEARASILTESCVYITSTGVMVGSEASGDLASWLYCN
mgnify:CR=1 FL=1|jgi:hypothetical protein